MKWFHWVIIVCVAVAGLLVWLYMLGSKSAKAEPGSPEYARQMKALKKAEEGLKDQATEEQEKTDEPTT